MQYTTSKKSNRQANLRGLITWRLSALALCTANAAIASDIPNAPLSPPSTQQLAEMYNSHFDFARSVHSLSVEKLAQKNIATPFPHDDFEVSYKITFAQPYTDVYGNTFRGEIIFQQTHQQKQAGDIEQMIFNDFYINEVLVRGSKISNIEEVVDGQARGSGWGSQRLLQADSGQTTTELLTMHFPNGQTMAFDGTFGKVVEYDITGQKQVVIEGHATAYVNDEKYTFQVTQPMRMASTCRWMEDGKITITNAANENLGIINLANQNCHGGYQIAQLNGETTQMGRQHNYWQ